MPVYEVETWKVAQGKEKEHEEAMREWMEFVHSHRELFPEWKSLQYFVKYIAGEETERQPPTTDHCSRPLPKPRDAAVRQSAEFTQLKEQIWSVVKEEVLKGMR